MKLQVIQLSKYFKALVNGGTLHEVALPFFLNGKYHIFVKPVWSCQSHVYKGKMKKKQPLFTHLIANTVIVSSVFPQPVQEWVGTWLPSRPVGSQPTCIFGPSPGCYLPRWGRTGPIHAPHFSPQVPLKCWLHTWGTIMHYNNFKFLNQVF